MTRDEVLTIANDTARAIGGSEVTSRALQDWVDAGLVPQPTIHGLGRGAGVRSTFSPDAVAVVRKIVELRQKGIRRKSLVAVYLWLDDQFSDAHKIREFLFSEFKRTLKYAVRGQKTQFDHRYGDISDGATFNRSVRALPKAAPILSHLTAAIPAEDILLAASSATWAYPDKADFKIPLMSSIAELGEGLFGAPDETNQSALKLIRNASEEDLAQAKQALLTFHVGVAFSGLIFDSVENPKIDNKTISYDVLCEGILSPDWIVGMTASFVALAIRKRHGRPISDPKN
jgi:hypothetical protein